MHIDTSVFTGDCCLNDSLDLHHVKRWECNTKATPTMAEHRVLLMEPLNRGVNLVDLDTQTLSSFIDAGFVVGKEFMEWRIQETDGHRKAVHCVEDTLEILLLERKESQDGGLAIGV